MYGASKKPFFVQVGINPYKRLSYKIYYIKPEISGRIQKGGNKMGLLKNGCGCNNAAAAAEENNCVGCACDQLRNLTQGTEIEDILVNGKTIEGLDDINFISFDSRTCCATFIARSGSDRVIFTLDCRKIDAIFFELED
jgi:hypothetical protein